MSGEAAVGLPSEGKIEAIGIKAKNFRGWSMRRVQ